MMFLVTPAGFSLSTFACILMLYRETPNTRDRGVIRGRGYMSLAPKISWQMPPPDSIKRKTKERKKREKDEEKKRETLTKM